MMRHVMIVMVALLAISLSACSQNKTKKENTDMEKKTLVAYFSATGTTEAVARQIADVAHADLYRITPEREYTEADLDWTDKQSRSTVEMRDRQSRPAIKGTVEHIGQYSTVYIGFPIWWYTAPTIINTFIEKNDLKGKDIKLFATSGGSTPDRALKELSATYPALTWRGATLLNNPDTARIRAFVEE